MKAARQRELIDKLDNWLLLGYGTKKTNAEGKETIAYGLKDICDVLKNIIVALTLLSACLYLLLGCNPATPDPGTSEVLFWSAILAMQPLSLLCALLFRQWLLLVFGAWDRAAEAKRSKLEKAVFALAMLMLLSIASALISTVLQAAHKLNQECRQARPH